MKEGTEGESVLPAAREVGHIDTLVALRSILTPLQECILASLAYHRSGSGGKVGDRHKSCLCRVGRRKTDAKHHKLLLV